jgi:hypothetical protein
VRVFLPVAAALLAAGCGGAESLANQCRARMNTLSSDMAMFRVTAGYWPDSAAPLDSLAGRSETLRCPLCGEPYRISARADGYIIGCPDGTHGEIDTGKPDWEE